MSNNKETNHEMNGENKESQAGRVIVPETNLQWVHTKVQEAINTLIALLGDAVLSTADRRRLLGSGVRRYGFIEKVADVG